jgi:hypothetical protein
VREQAVAAAADVLGERFDVDKQFLRDHLQYERVAPNIVCKSRLVWSGMLCGYWRTLWSITLLWPIGMSI